MKKILMMICLFASVGAMAQDTAKVSQPGKATIKIDGQTKNLSDMLYVIDGVKADKAALSRINTNDIESMSVLKNENATALYGPEGKNGVILIATKAGSKKNQPVYIIDGMKADAAKFKALNPDDIASVDITKDAKEIALYGPEGKNGVVKVTTKAAAKKEKSKIKF